MSVTDLTLYRNKAYLTLCLDLVESAYHDLRQGNYELAISELRDILETFDVASEKADREKAKVLDFQYSQPED